MFTSFFHNHCPAGTNSWCLLKRAVANGEEPSSNWNNVGTLLAKDVAEQVKEVYVRLGHPKLLRHCARQDPKRQQEPALKGVDRMFLMRVVAATCLAIAEFNQSYVDSDTQP